MAGFYTRLDGHVYEGAFTAGEELENGVFAEITADGVKKITAAGDTKFRVDEKTTLWGLPAVRLTCIELGADPIYFVENEFEIYQNEDYDESLYTVPVGHFVKMRRPVVNDQVIMSVDDTTYAAVAVGDEVAPASGGGIA